MILSTPSLRRFARSHRLRGIWATEDGGKGGLARGNGPAPVYRYASPTWRDYRRALGVRRALEKRARRALAAIGEQEDARRMEGVEIEPPRGA